MRCPRRAGPDIALGVELALYRRGLVFMEQRRFRRASADFVAAAAAVPDARGALERSKYAAEQQGDADDKGSPGRDE